MHSFHIKECTFTFPITIDRVEDNLTIIEWHDGTFDTIPTYLFPYTVYEGQEALECSVTQSEGPEENKEFVNIIHQEDLKLPKGRPAKQPIDITYSYDESGKMHCMFTDVESGNSHEIELTPESTQALDRYRKQIEEISVE